MQREYSENAFDAKRPGGLMSKTILQCAADTRRVSDARRSVRCMTQTDQTASHLYYYDNISTAFYPYISRRVDPSHDHLSARRPAISRLRDDLSN